MDEFNKTEDRIYKKNVLIIEDHRGYFEKIQKALNHPRIQTFPAINVENIHEFESFVCDLGDSLDRSSSLQKISKKNLCDLIPFNNIDLVILDYELSRGGIKKGIHGINFINEYLTKDINPPVLFFSGVDGGTDYNRIIECINDINAQKKIHFYGNLTKTAKWRDQGDSEIDKTLLSVALNVSKEKGIYFDSNSTYKN
jgi:hypothetical protein